LGIELEKKIGGSNLWERIRRGGKRDSPRKHAYSKSYSVIVGGLGRGTVTLWKREQTPLWEKMRNIEPDKVF